MQLLEIEEFSLLLNCDISNKRVWPLSLLAIRSLLKICTLPRKQNSLPYNCNNFGLNGRKVKSTLHIFKHVRLKNVFRKHVKPKKMYEIAKMSKKIAEIAAASGVQCVVDVGSGVGHLCRSLAYLYQLKVVGVEVQEDLCVRARKLDEELEVTASKHLSMEEMIIVKECRPVHVNSRLNEHCTPEQFIEIIKNSIITSSKNFGIVGLHPCGDLAPNLLRLFVNCPRIRFISIVSCCYDKLTLNSPQKCFPLSKFVSNENVEVKSASAALACHANEASSAKLLSGDYHYLKIHCFRATLETIIRKRFPSLANCAIGNVKHYPDLTFKQYCEKALKKLDIEISDEDLNSPETCGYLNRWKEALFYHVVWLMFAPAVETVIQLDRLLYLAEQGIPCELDAVFDPTVSPRNNVLSAIKR